MHAMFAKMTSLDTSKPNPVFLVPSVRGAGSPVSSLDRVVAHLVTLGYLLAPRALLSQYLDGVMKGFLCVVQVVCLDPLHDQNAD